MAESQFVFAAILGLATQLAAQPCEPHWSDEFPHGGIDGTVHALTVADLKGPAGPVLVAGFDGDSAGGIPANHVAQWDGHHWSPLGLGLDGNKNAVVGALAVYDEDGDGPGPPVLFAGGTFANAGGEPIAAIARWDGQTWSPVGDGVSFGLDLPAVYALRVIDEDGPGPGRPALIVGGSFTAAGNAQARFIARWDGSTWSTLGSGLDKPALALEVFDDDGDGPNLPALFAGGKFQFAGGKQVNRLAKWNGQAWEKWESGITDEVRALAVMDDDGDGPGAPALYVGGEFWQVGGQPFGGIGRWDGQTWSDLTGGTDGSVDALSAFDPDGDGPNLPSLFVAGSFSTAGGVQAHQNARWDGYNWSEPDGDVVSRIYAFAGFDSDGPGPALVHLYAGGNLGRAGQALPDNLAALVDGTWRSLGAGFDGLGPAQLLSVPDDPAGPSLYAAGVFGTVDGVTADEVARWDGHTWSGLNGGIDWRQQSNPVVIGLFDPDEDGPLPRDLYAAGEYQVGEYESHYVLARWSGQAWDEVATLPGGAPHAMMQFDEDAEGPAAPALFVAGYLSGHQVVRWDGNSLSDVGGGLKDGVADALAGFDFDGPGPQPARLVVCGDFRADHGAPASYVAAWDGSSWTAVGDNLTSSVNDLRVIDPDGPGLEPPVLYAEGGLPSGLAYWSDTEWVSIGNYLVATITGFDPDGAGPARTDLYGANSWLYRRVNNKWGTLAGKANDFIAVLAAHDDGTAPALYIAGRFTIAGGQSAGHFTRLECPPLPCYADCTLDGALDLFDFLCFVNLFNSADPAADCDASGALDLFDFLCFVNLFNSGCP